jgi:hypothetical protein
MPKHNSNQPSGYLPSFLLTFLTAVATVEILGHLQAYSAPGRFWNAVDFSANFKPVQSLAAGPLSSNPLPESAPDAESVRLGASLYMATSRNNRWMSSIPISPSSNSCNKIFPKTVSGRCGTWREHSSSPAKTWTRRSAHSPAEKSRGWQ